MREGLLAIGITILAFLVIPWIGVAMIWYIDWVEGNSRLKSKPTVARPNVAPTPSKRRLTCNTSESMMAEREHL